MIRTAWEEFAAWLIAGTTATAILTPIVWFVAVATGHTITVLTALGIAALIAFVGVVVIRITDNTITFD